MFVTPLEAYLAVIFGCRSNNPVFAYRRLIRLDPRNAGPELGTKYHAFPVKAHIVMTATGSFDLIGSKFALKSAALEPSFSAQKEILVDLRDIECTMSTFDVYELAQNLAFPNPALDTSKRIAVLIGGSGRFTHAQFEQLAKKTPNIRAFEELKSADRWLHAEADSPRVQTDSA